MVKEMNDIALDSVDDLLIENGDFDVTESMANHQRQLLLNDKGDFKEQPTICVGTPRYFDDEQLENLVRAINVEFTRDGMDVSEVSIDKNGIIRTDASYQ